MSNLSNYSEYLGTCIRWGIVPDDYILGSLAQEAQRKENPMKKTWKHAGSSTPFDSLDAAIDAAKRYAKDRGSESVTIYEAVKVIVTPTPDYEVRDVTA